MDATVALPWSSHRCVYCYCYRERVESRGWLVSSIAKNGNVEAFEPRVIKHQEGRMGVDDPTLSIGIALPPFEYASTLIPSTRNLNFILCNYA